MKTYEHVKCDCRGIIGAYTGPDTYVCDRCDKKYFLHEIHHAMIYINAYTGWTFPVKLKRD